MEPFCLLICSTYPVYQLKIPKSIQDHIPPLIKEVHTTYIGEPFVTAWSTVPGDALVLPANFGLKRITAYHPKGEYILIGKQGSVRVYQHGRASMMGGRPETLNSLKIVRDLYTSGAKEIPKAKQKAIFDALEPIKQTLFFAELVESQRTITYGEFVQDRL